MTHPKIGLIVLCAGASRRMGTPKALLQAPCGQTFLQRIVSSAAASGVDVCAAVVGPPHGAIIREAHPENRFPMPVTWAWNATPQHGMLSSVQVALSALRSTAPSLKGAWIWPVDIPFVASQTLQTMLEKQGDAAQTHLVVPVYQGRGGHPLWVPAALFTALASLDPINANHGLHTFRERHLYVTQRHKTEDEAVLRDFDKPQDLFQLV